MNSTHPPEPQEESLQPADPDVADARHDHGHGFEVHRVVSSEMPYFEGFCHDVEHGCEVPS